MQVKSLVYRLRSSTLIRSFGVQKGVSANPSCIARSFSHSPPCVCNIRSAWASLPLHLHGSGASQRLVRKEKIQGNHLRYARVDDECRGIAKNQGWSSSLGRRSGQLPSLRGVGPAMGAGNCMAQEVSLWTSPSQ